MIIAIDFDGTCVTHEFPNIGQDIGAAPVLRELVENGHKLILFTMRSDVKEPRSYDKEILEQAGMHLSDAIIWFNENQIELYGIQVNPEQHTWTTSPKAYAQMYIDDAALGCPLIYPRKDEFNNLRIGKPFVDWVKVREMLEKQKNYMSTLKRVQFEYSDGTYKFIEGEELEKVQATIDKYPEYFPWEHKWTSIPKEVHEAYNREAYPERYEPWGALVTSGEGLWEKMNKKEMSFIKSKKANKPIDLRKVFAEWFKEEEKQRKKEKRKENMEQTL